MSSDLTLDELSALCDEMVSLSRAGVPLDRGLVELARELPHRLKRQAEQISERLRQGKPLAEVVGEEQSAFPEVYQSVVEAGIRSGQPAAALEGFSRFARQLAETRRIVAAALLYPSVLMVVIGVASYFVLSNTADTLRMTIFIQAGERLSVAETHLLNTFELVARWFWVLPATLVALVVFWCFNTRRAKAADSQRFSRWIGWVPGSRQLLRASNLLSFCRILKLLVQQRVPLEQAVQLAGRSCGDPGIRKHSQEIAKNISRGENWNESSFSKKSGIPPLLVLGLANSRRTEDLLTVLENSEQTYATRTKDYAEWMRLYVPMAFTVLFGGVVSVLYIITMIFPWAAVMQLLLSEMNSL